MTIKNVTPTMTSNIAPEPYRVSCNSILSDMYNAWKAFNGTNINGDDCWCTDNYTSGSYTSGWITMDFGNSVAVSGVELTSRNDVQVHSFEKFEVYGSIDGEEWKLISSFDEGISSSPNTKKTFSFEKMYSYRHYKINIPRSDDMRIAIGEINFIYDARLKDKKLDFYKTLSKNVPSLLESDGNEVHFTEKGEIFSYDMFGNRVELGGSDLNITKSEW